ncbi:MAG: chromosome segregation protein SMC [Candidatus Woesearchaeota archaeon]|nr:MAG: chromosome segregation protein SMC [Candidatus Woesearchaeota archaeon]
MTVIKSMKLSGFKSFAKPTELVFGNGFNICIGPNGSGKSLSYDSKVLLDNGEEVVIGEFVEEQFKKTNEIKKLDDGVYCDNTDDIKLLSLNPSLMKLEEKMITKFIKKEGEPYLFEIKTRSGKKIKCTGCHPVMVFRDGKIVSSLVRDLSKNELIASPRIIYTNSISNDKDFARLFGYIVGDGYIAKDRIEFINSDKELIEDFKKLMFNLFNLEVQYEKKDNKTTKLIYWSKEFRKKIVNLIKNEKNKYTSEFKYIPKYLLGKDKETIANLIAGLYDTDGTIDKNKSVIEFCSKNEQLTDQIQRLLLRFGIISRKKERLNCASNTVNKTKRKYYYLYIEGYKNLVGFYQSIPLKCLHKKLRLESKVLVNKKINPNIDLLPKETNKLIRKAVELLGVRVKPFLRKEHSKIAAYLENRCNPTREGLNEILPILSKKLVEIYTSGLKLKKDQLQLVEVMDQLALSGRQTSQAIGLNQDVIRGIWATNKFQAKPKNLDAFFNFIQSAINNRLSELKTVMDTLYRLANSEIFWDQVVEINKVDGEKYVYDLTVEDNHNFVGNGLFVHNSNIMDALCFVLGKISAKSMRAEKSANLIYNGGKEGNPAKYASVGIIFDNSNKTFPIEAKTIEITRMVNKNGISRYKINDEVRTRQQVVDLLYAAKIDPDGHNIVLQGDIVAFTEMKTEIRRQLIEEVSGISMYEEKKAKAMNELEKVQLKLGEAEIILKERETYLRELKKDRDQALKFRDLQDKIKSNKATYLELEIKQREEKRDEIDSKINKAKSEIDKINGDINKLKNKINEYKENINKINEDIELKGEKEQIALQKDIENLKTSIVKNEERLNTCNNEVSKIKTRKEQLQNDLEENSTKIEQLNKEKKDFLEKRNEFNKKIKELEGKIEQFKKKHGIKDSKDVEEGLSKIDKKLEEEQLNIERIQENKQELIREKDKLGFQVSGIDEEIKKIEELIKSSKGKFDELKNKKDNFKDISNELGKLINEDTSLASQINKTRKELAEKNEALAKLSARHAGLEENLRSDPALKKVLELKKSIKGIYGTISELGKVDSKYALALEIAAGPRIKSVIVDNDETAEKCISILKENKLGVATFLPLNKIKAKTVSEQEKEIASKNHGFAMDLVKFDKKFDNAFAYVFGSTIIVDDVAKARAIGIGRARIVTLDGDLIEPSGAMIGGFRRRNIGLGFKEDDISSELIKIEEEVSRLRKLINNLEGKRVENEDKIKELRDKKNILEGEIVRIENSLDVKEEPNELKEKKKELNSKLNEFEKKIKESDINVNKSVKTINELKESRSELIETLTKSKGDSSLAKFEEERANLRESLIRIDGDIRNVDNQINLIKPEADNILKILKQHTRELEDFMMEAALLDKELKKQGDLLKNKDKEEKEFISNYKGLFVKRNKLNEEIQKFEINVVKEEEKVRGVEGKVNNFNIDRAKVIAELEALMFEFKDYEGVKVRKGIIVDELKSEIKEFEKMMQNMGNINMRALEIYERVEKEYSELTEKHSKLKIEKEDVLNMIQEVEGKKKDLFMKTFSELNTNFQNIFTQLSNKGQAYLEIENEENLFESGVEIKVKLGSNKYMDIKSLSGGEKTLTALAFIFAIQEYYPASFYLLDEVDAALDKHNSEKLSKLIKKYAEKAQYIVISHNDNVITEADQIYGVSMQSNGISKVVSLKI